MQGRKGRMAKRFKSIKIYEESYGYLITLKAEDEAETRKNYTLAEAFHALVKSSYDNMLKAKSGRRPADPYSPSRELVVYLPCCSLTLVERLLPLSPSYYHLPNRIYQRRIPFQ